MTKKSMWFWLSKIINRVRPKGITMETIHLTDWPRAHQMHTATDPFILTDIEWHS